MFPVATRRPLRHHLHQIAVAEFEPQVPPHAEDHDLPVEVAALEQLIQTQERGHRTAFSLLEAPNVGAQTVCTRALYRPDAGYRGTRADLAAAGAGSAQSTPTCVSLWISAVG